MELRFAFSFLIFHLCLYSISGILASQTTPAPTTRQSWIKFCKDQHKKQILTQKCTKGTKLSNDLQVECICVNGIWALFGHSCKEPVTIVFGKGNCFQIQTKVKYFVNMDSIRQDNVHLIGKNSWLLANQIIESKNPSTISAFIGHPSPPRPWAAAEVLQEAVCIKYLTLEARMKSPLIYNFSSKIVVMKRGHNLTCDSKFLGVEPMKLKLGEIYVSNARGPVTAPGCQLACEGSSEPHEHKIGKRSVTTNDRSPSPSPTIIDDSESFRRVQQNEATAHILRQNDAFLLFGIKDSLNVSKNWKFIQKANKILKSACPNLDPTIQNSMIRMFRILFGKFQNGQHAPTEYLESDSRTKRILDTLDRCAADSKVFELKLGPPDACEKDKRITEGKIAGIMQTFEKDELKLSENEAFGKDRHDILIESIWKLITFIHYFCAEYFQSIPFDYAALTQIFTGFLNEDIIYRWNNPEISNQGLYAVFNIKNKLDRYSEGLDTCVALAKTIANFKVWIDRPTIWKNEDVKTTTPPKSIRRGKRSIDATFQSSQCLKQEATDLSDWKLDICL